MATIQIPNLGAVVGIDGTELIEVVQSGTSKRATTGQIAGLTIGITSSGETGEILVGNTGGAPSWSSTPTISGSLSIGSIDTTITRSAAGVLAVEGGIVPLENRANTFSVTQTINNASLLINSNSDYEPQVSLVHAGATAGSGPYFICNRARGTYVSPTIVLSGDMIGTIYFEGYDGTTYRGAAAINAYVSGTPGSNDMPGALTFSTSSDGSASPSERVRIESTGNVGIGTALLTSASLRVSKNITGAVLAYGVISEGTVQSDVTNIAYGYYSQLSTVAATFTINEIRSFSAGQGTIGAGTTLNNQTGYNASGGMIAATNNYGFFAGDSAAVTAGKTAYGFYSAVNIASGGGTTWGFYANGTAPNFFGGVTSSNNWYNTSTQTATNTVTLTAAQITAPFLLGTPTGTASYTLPLASAVETALRTPAVGTGWEFTVFTTAAFAITILTNTGWTLVGSMATGATANSFARFRAAKTGAAAYSLYRIN